MENTNARIITELQKMQKLYDKYFLTIANEENLTKIEVFILGFLANNPNYNTAKSIEEVLEFKKSNISVAIEDLNSRGYIGKHSDKNDRRISRLSLMPISYHIVTKIKQTQEQFFQRVFEGITKEEMDSYCATVRKILENIGRMSNYE